MKRSSLIAPALGLAAVLSFVVLGLNGQDSVAAGFSYPLLGLAHILAALAVGVWAARLGEHAPLVLPAIFVLSAGMGMILAVEEIQLLLFVGPMIWVSVLALTYAAVHAVRVSLGDTIGVVGLSGLYHSYALGGAMGSAETLSIDVALALSLTGQLPLAADIETGRF